MTFSVDCAHALATKRSVIIPNVRPTKSTNFLRASKEVDDMDNLEERIFTSVKDGRLASTRKRRILAPGCQPEESGDTRRVGNLETGRRQTQLSEAMFRQLSYRKSTEKLIERARLEPRYNIAPTQQVPVILTVSARSLESERKSKPNPFWLGLSGLRPQA